MASLSLALGLSDEIQSRAGGIRSGRDVCGRRVWKSGRGKPESGDPCPVQPDQRQSAGRHYLSCAGTEGTDWPADPGKEGADGKQRGTADLNSYPVLMPM